MSALVVGIWSSKSARMQHQAQPVLAKGSNPTSTAAAAAEMSPSSTETGQPNSARILHVKLPAVPPLCSEASLSMLIDCLIA